MTSVRRQGGFIIPWQEQERYKIGNAPLVGVWSWGEPTPPERTWTSVLFNGHVEIVCPAESGDYVASGETKVSP